MLLLMEAIKKIKVKESLMKLIDAINQRYEERAWFNSYLSSTDI